MPESKAEKKRPHLVLGLAGGIGSGKSAVAAALEKDFAFLWINADRIAREELESETLRPELERRFGPEIFSEQGHLDRQRLADLVFADEERRKELEGLVHPATRKRIRGCLAEAAANGQRALLDVPLLFEGGLGELCDLVLFVDCPERLRRERAVARGMRSEDWARREAQQMPVAEKRRRAELVVDNSGTLEELRARLAELRPVLIPTAS
ncbi:MAG: dephospho-CoA kinase [Planctomycetota bacterium]|nr:MAG: dephospho-CoA kinase [Planctomycetota bacterium]